MVGGGFQKIKGGKMGTMSWIAHLCETGKRDELIIEVEDLANQLNTSAEEVADGFLDAHRNMRYRKDEESFKVLNEITDKMLEKYSGKK
tara:strand:- start:21180 stop:21446 length:267 start_codon:yes stop_codon:yes gene_type:complete